MAQEKLDTKERILKAANSLFYGEGIRAVSVDAVAHKAGITKKTLYYHFQSKDDLVTEYLKSRDQPNMDAFQKWFDEAEGDLSQKVFEIFSNIAKSADHPKWRGCGFFRTAGELAHLPGHPAVKAGAAHKKRLEAWLAVIFTEKAINYPETLARRIVLLLDGAFASALIHRDPDYVLEAGRTAKVLIKNSSIETQSVAE